jgi:hypothetical protein
MSGSELPTRFSFHAQLQCTERGATEAEVVQAIRKGLPEPVKLGRWMYRLNLPFDAQWQGRHYAVKQVCPVVADKADGIVVITVYTFYF